MRHTLRYLILTLAVLIVCVLAIFPPDAKLRRGKDLAGGATLVYGVQLAPGDPPTVVDSMIEVLKDRVDPDGVMQIAFNRQGRDRIEVSMPLPTEQVRRLKRAYLQLIDEAAAQTIDPAELDRVLRLEPAERRARLERLAAGNDARLATLMKAADAADAAAAARAAYDEAVAAPAPQDQQNTLLAAAGDAAIALDEARRAALAMSVTKRELESALSLSNERRKIRDAVTNTVETQPSPRERAIERIKQGHPEAVAQVDRIVAAYDEFLSKRRGLDDPQDLKRLLRGAGVLNFRIAVRAGADPNEERLRRELRATGPRGVRSTEARWFPIHDIATWYENKQQWEFLRADPAAFFHSLGGDRQGFVGEERDGVYYLLLYDRPGSRMTEADGKWAVSDAYQGQDALGRPAIAFQMDALGARLLGALTGPNLGEPMAVLLDDKVYTAPTLEGAISSNGQITGTFPPSEIQYLIRTLGAGALQGKLFPEPISEDVLGPELGADNLRKGLIAGVISFVSVGVFMVAYYFSSGVVAMIALLFNAVIILGLMALTRAVFTLPGIAGVVLTFGAAVDSNVLIYERIREELQRGANLPTAVRQGFDRAFTTIVDSNVTNLIVCLVLYYFGTQEIRGFAVTLGIGILGTLFTAIIVTRLVLSFMIEHLRIKRLLQLPMVIPAIQRWLTPRIDWLGLRPVFFTISAILVAFGLYAIAIRGEAMLDNEFRGGVAVTVQLKQEDPDGPAGPALARPLVKTRSEIEELVKGRSRGAAPDQTVEFLQQAEILPVDPLADGVSSSRFKVKTIAHDASAVSDAIVRALSDLIEVAPPLRFAGADGESLSTAPVRRILDPVLGPNIDRPDVRVDVSRFVGGAAVVLENFEEPLPTLDGLVNRLRQMRENPAFSDISNRPTDVVVLEEGPDRTVRSAVVLVVDEHVTIFDEEAVWKSAVAEKEWKLVREAMIKSTTLAGVQSFSPQIAGTFKAQAVVAIVFSLLGILVYIWLRFGSLRYSLAAIVALIHDTFVMIGFIALAESLYNWAPTVAGGLLIVPFKIDLEIIAALLAIICYSLNDKIVIMDRIRENRGKLAHASKQVVNDSINQTFSRTIVLGGTTVFAVLVLYILGGDALRGFSYTILVGTFVGTYSSVAIAAPLVYSRKTPPTPKAVRDRPHALAAT